MPRFLRPIIVVPTDLASTSTYVYTSPVDCDGGYATYLGIARNVIIVDMHIYVIASNSLEGPGA